MSALNEKQSAALASIDPKWGYCPVRVKSATLLALHKRGLIEIRLNPAYNGQGIMQPYTSCYYQVRLKPKSP